MTQHEEDIAGHFAEALTLGGSTPAHKAFCASHSTSIMTPGFRLCGSPDFDQQNIFENYLGDIQDGPKRHN
jgi:hypothetical protein